jgi:hypothetical protein
MSYWARTGHVAVSWKREGAASPFLAGKCCCVRFILFRDVLSQMDDSAQANECNMAGSPSVGNIVAFGRQNIEESMEQWVRAKYQHMIDHANIVGWFLIERRIRKVVARKMKKFSPHCLY